MKIFDKKLISASILTLFVLTCLFLINGKESYALTDLSVPEITSLEKSSLESNALKVEFKSGNTGSNFSYELVNTNTGKSNILSGSATSYTYQNLEPGEYKIQIKACSNAVDDYSCTDFSEVKSAEVLPDSVDSMVVKLSQDVYVYDGKVKEPIVTVTDNGRSLVKDIDFKVEYASGRINIGSYKVVVTGMGDYNFTKDLTFKINPPATTIKSKSATKNSITAKFTSKSGGIKYQLGYKKKSASSYKTVNTSKTSLTIKKLSKGTNYNLKVRTYKVVNKVTYYSSWSKVYSIKTKGKASTSSSSSSSGSSAEGSYFSTSGCKNSGETFIKKYNTCMKKATYNRYTKCKNSGGGWNFNSNVCICPSGKKLSNDECKNNSKNNSKSKLNKGTCKYIGGTWKNGNCKCRKGETLKYYSSSSTGWVCESSGNSSKKKNCPRGQKRCSSNGKCYKKSKFCASCYGKGWKYKKDGKTCYKPPKSAPKPKCGNRACRSVNIKGKCSTLGGYNYNTFTDKCTKKKCSKNKKWTQNGCV